MLDAQTKAPNFNLQDHDGNNRTLSEFKGRWVVLYFYPKDDTPGCTKEACGFRDLHDEFIKRSATTLGVSKDSSESHTKFIQKYNLPFILLSDPDGTMIKDYGAWGEKKFMGRTFDGVHRITYLINPDGLISKIYKKVKPAIHAREILDDIDALST